MFWKRKKSVKAEAPLVAIVDDDQDICRVLRTLLLEERYQVDMAHDGEEGLELIRRRRPSLVLLDIKMPRLNGYQVLAQMQQAPELKDIPVFVMTSVTEDYALSDRDWAEKLQVAHFITKPFDPDKLVHLIRSRVRTA